MTSSKPYLIRALYEWMVDNGMTPQLVVDTTDERVDVPREFSEKNRIVLNVAPSAVHGLDLGGTDITFAGRFSGRSISVCVPVWSVRAIFARENGRGMEFEVEADVPPPMAPDDNKPRLRVVK